MPLALLRLWFALRSRSKCITTNHGPTPTTAPGYGCSYITVHQAAPVCSCSYSSIHQAAPVPDVVSAASTRRRLFEDMVTAASTRRRLFAAVVTAASTRWRLFQMLCSKGAQVLQSRSINVEDAANELIDMLCAEPVQSEGDDDTDTEDEEAGEGKTDEQKTGL